jgi:chromosome segregation ATPase
MYSSSTANQTMPFSEQAEAKQKKRQERSITKSQKKNNKQAKNVILLSAIWIILMGGGYLLAHTYIENSRSYIDERLQEAQTANLKQMTKLEEQVKQLSTKLGTVQDGLGSIQEGLQMTGEKLGGTDRTKQALTTRIDQLNKQLTELRTSLKKLEDAARAW